MELYKNIRLLPNELIELIKSYLPNKIFIFTNKYYYAMYHYLLLDTIKMYDTYVRDTIRRDNEFVFRMIFGENIEKWIKNKQYIYKNMIFTNYIYFIMHYCNENNSDNCKKIIYDFLSKRELCRNLHKKKVVKYIK